MKVTLLTKNITSYLSLINKVLPSHSQVPILTNVLLLASKDGFFIKATDLEIGVEIKIPAKIEEEGGVTIPGREFIETINSFPKDKVEILQEKDVVSLNCRGNTVKLNTIPIDEFPSLFKEKGDKAASFKKQEFLDIFESLTFSVSQEDTRLQLTGILIDVKDKGVNFVATDGYRMSVKRNKVVGKNFSESLIVSVKLINEVMALKNEDEISLFINKGESQIIFEIGNVVLVGRMIEGEFPDYEKVLPKEEKTKVDFDREEFFRAVKLVSVFAKDVSNVVSVEISDSETKLLSKAQGVGEGKAVVECKKTGEDNKTSLNIRYLSDVLKNLSEKEVTLVLNSPNEPALFKAGADYLHVIMPIQVED